MGVRAVRAFQLIPSHSYTWFTDWLSGATIRLRPRIGADPIAGDARYTGTRIGDQVFHWLPSKRHVSMCGAPAWLTPPCTSTSPRASSAAAMSARAAGETTGAAGLQ